MGDGICCRGGDSRHRTRCRDAPSCGVSAECGFPCTHSSRTTSCWRRWVGSGGSRCSSVEGSASSWPTEAGGGSSSLGSGGAVCPAILDDRKRKIALSSVVVGGYGINGKTYGFTLHLGEKHRFSRANRWILRHYEDEIATVTRHPSAIDASDVPVHLGAVLISFTPGARRNPRRVRARFTFRWD